MTSISIFLIWPDSILNKLEPLSYTAVHKSELRDDSVWTPHTTQTQMTLMFPKALSHGGWESLGRVGHGQKEELQFISCFRISFQPLLDPVSLTSFSLHHTLPSAGPPCPASSFKAGLLHEPSPPRSLLVMACIFPAAPVWLFYEMGCRMEELWKF